MLWKRPWGIEYGLNSAVIRAVLRPEYGTFNYGVCQVFRGQDQVDS